eukprot:4431111-Amphidinium_carterae.1
MSALWSQGMYGAELEGPLWAKGLAKGVLRRSNCSKNLGWAGRQGPPGGSRRHVVTHLGSMDPERRYKWPPRPTQWEQALRKAGGPLSALAEFAHRVSWHPGEAGWQTTRGFVPWCQASATGAQDSQAWLLKQLAQRRTDFEGLEAGLDPVDLQ